MGSFLRWSRRFVTLSALGLWLGGFTLYTGFVIPVGHRQIPSGRFGFVTGEVTSILNILAAVAALLLLVNLLAEGGRWGRFLRWGTAGTWVILVAATAGLFVLHAQLDGLLDYTLREIAHRDRFEPLHERYEAVATIQWAAGMLHLGCVLAGWRRSDAASGVPGESSPGR